MQQMIYPDGETLTYGYDRGGQVTSVTGVTQHGQTLKYVKAITYDDYGQRVFIHYGNDVTTAYQYDPNRRWLSHIKTENSRGRVYQDTSYGFDAVGDVLSVTNDGYKKVTQTYGYDSLYELTSAQGTYTRPSYELDQVHKVDQYAQSFTYDVIGNMSTQTSSHNHVSPASPSPETLNYNFTYQYSAQHPHQATRIGNWGYQYDANGNVVAESYLGGTPGDHGYGNGGSDSGNHGGESLNVAPSASADYPSSELRRLGAGLSDNHSGPGNGERDNSGNYRYGDHRFGGVHGEGWGMRNPHFGEHPGTKQRYFVWDEENRLIHTAGFGSPTDYLYDYQGNRALKRGEHGETWYIDQYTQIQNGHQVEKQVFLGSTRLVTRLEDKDWYDSNYEEHNIYYYHPDHLGSTTFVTTQDGREWEHMEYTPYGQQWIDEGRDKSVIPYRFTSKEYDAQTGLYYYGKRYLDPMAARSVALPYRLTRLRIPVVAHLRT